MGSGRRKPGGKKTNESKDSGQHLQTQVETNKAKQVLSLDENLANFLYYFPPHTSRFLQLIYPQRSSRTSTGKD